MTSVAHYLDTLFFATLPYVALVLFLVGTIYRYRSDAFTYSSLSSQLLENKQHFWALVPFHYGIIAVLTGHFVAFLIPRSILAWNSRPLRLYVLEVSALIFGLTTLVSLFAIIARRATDSRVRVVTSKADWILYAMLVVQVFTGVYVAVFNRWGSSWFAASAAPYFWSLLKLNPDISVIAAMPWMVKIHIVNAFVVIAFFPFTRLVHILVVPNQYLFRRRQVVRWYRRPRLVRSDA
ncbi:MAG TPA: respiratory nitrate reductase subunit gamma [Thermoanaerobaculia bacterium]|nr:respiratory nitrate reductase subunit gamma [Thermoanaerobaculia bacterium]